MLTEPEKRAAQLAVEMYGADPVRVQSILEGVAQARKGGESRDLLNILVAQKLLSPSQAEDLRFGLLDKTQTDFSSAKNRESRNQEEAGIRSQGSGIKNRKPEGKGQKTELDLAGPRILGPYHILRLLGEGGMGAVYLAYQEGKGQQVALKVLASHQADIPASVDRFYREAKNGSLLNHVNIVRILDSGKDADSGRHYLVMEFVDGPSALNLLTCFKRLSAGDAVHIILDIARALEHAHSRNIIHRDIKPGNILLTRSGVAKLADLGLAKRTDDTSNLTAARQGLGTPYYVPYEQAMNARLADARSDIFALGATLFHLVTGEVPFPGKNHMEMADKKNLGIYTPASIINPDVPKLLDRILAKMLARDPRDRYQTASELIVDLERANLASPVPSFIDADLAMQDPFVRQRIIAPAQHTSPDLNQPPKAQPSLIAEDPDIWYLRYRDSQGGWFKAKVTTAQIQEKLRQGRLSSQSELARQPQGDFQPIARFPQFQEFFPQVQAPSPDDQSTIEFNPPSSFGRWIGIGIGVGIVGLILVAVLKALQLI